MYSEVMNKSLQTLHNMCRAFKLYGTPPYGNELLDAFSKCLLRLPEVEEEMDILCTFMLEVDKDNYPISLTETYELKRIFGSLGYSFIKEIRVSKGYIDKYISEMKDKYNNLGKITSFG